MQSDGRRLRQGLHFCSLSRTTMNGKSLRDLRFCVVLRSLAFTTDRGKPCKLCAGCRQGKGPSRRRQSRAQSLPPELLLPKSTKTVRHHALRSSTDHLNRNAEHDDTNMVQLYRALLFSLALKQVTDVQAGI